MSWGAEGANGEPYKPHPEASSDVLGKPYPAGKQNVPQYGTKTPNAPKVHMGHKVPIGLKVPKGPSVPMVVNWGNDAKTASDDPQVWVRDTQDD